MGSGAQFAGDEHYELIEQLGEGGEGIVYRARHRVRGDLVALKTISVSSPERVLRLKREFRELRELRHPNIVRLHELSEGGGHWYYTMELVDGQDVLSYVSASDGMKYERLRQVLKDLTGAVQAIHERGLVHRDLTPQNVLVTAEGRVVLIDLGVSLRSSGTTGEELIGTAAYMAPEQAVGATVTSACDWYSVGVIVYEVLFGRLPFRGTALEILEQKQDRVPEFPALDSDSAVELVGLCEALLKTLPNERGDAWAIFDCVGPPTAARRAPTETIVPTRLGIIDSALIDARNGSPSMVLVHGTSGAGKTAMLAQFARDEGHAGLFQSTCSADESVPFRAIDGVMDAIVEYLVALPPDMAGRLLPVRAAPLVRAFPLLARVDAAARWTDLGGGERIDREGLARALAELLEAIAEREGSVILVVDDLHHADADSHTLLARLLVDSATRRLLVVASVRVTNDPQLWIEGLHRAAEISDATIAHVVLTDGDEPSRSDDDEDEVHLVVGEPQARSWSQRSVSEPAWELLGTIAMAESPVPRAKAAQALGWDLKELTKRQRELSDCGAINASGVGMQASLGLVDEQERAYLREQLDETVEARLHLGLGRSFATEPADHERAARHFQQGGDEARAAHRYAIAADEAASVFACSRAVHLYEQTLWLLAEDDGRRFGLLARAADALVGAGRLAEAAQRYVEAASEAQDAVEARELKRCAADCFLRSGHVDEGIDSHREVCAAMGIKLPASPRGALRSLVWRRMRLRTRRLDYSAREPATVPVDAAMRIDTLLAAGLELSMLDFIRGADLQARGLIAALKTGDEQRIVRGLITEAAYQAGGGDHRRATKLLVRAGEVVTRLDDAYLRAFLQTVVGITTLLRGEWDAGMAACDDGLQLFRAECTGVEWEIATTEHFARWALFYQGNFAELTKRVLADLRGAEVRGDLLTGTMSRAGWGNLIWLAKDDVHAARAHCEQAAADWTHERFLTPHWALMLARTNLELYCGHAEQAQHCVEQAWPDIERALFLRAESRRIEAKFLRARCALAMLASNPGSARWRSEVQAWTRSLMKEKLSWSQGLASLCRAALAHLDDQRDEAINEAARASAIFAERGALLFEVVADSISYLHDGTMNPVSYLAGKLPDVRRPVALANMLAPGFSPDRGSVGEISHDGVEVIRAPLTGHLTVASLRRVTTDIEAVLERQGISSLIFDTIAMSGYDAAARLAFVAWHRTNRHHIKRCAIITDRTSWRLIVRTMALVADTDLRAFSSAAEAMSWASGS